MRFCYERSVRRGDGEDEDKIVADIHVTDPATIAEIQDGKREISCGYRCDYETNENGELLQYKIRGNYVALVNRGRAGKNVRIKDHDTVCEERFKPQTKTKKENLETMKKSIQKSKTGVLAKFLNVVTHDADPEEVAEIIEELVKKTTDEDGAETEKKPEKKGEKRKETQDASQPKTRTFPQEMTD